MSSRCLIGSGPRNRRPFQKPLKPFARAVGYNGLDDMMNSTGTLRSQASDISRNRSMRANSACRRPVSTAGRCLLPHGRQHDIQGRIKSSAGQQAVMKASFRRLFLRGMSPDFPMIHCLTLPCYADCDRSLTGCCLCSACRRGYVPAAGQVRNNRILRDLPIETIALAVTILSAIFCGQYRCTGLADIVIMEDPGSTGHDLRVDGRDHEYSGSGRYLYWRHCCYRTPHG